MLTAVISLAVAVVALSALYAVSVFAWQRERTELLNRLMSRGLTEYIRITNEGSSEPKKRRQDKRAAEWRGERNE